jgi:hypothetical protein
MADERTARYISAKFWPVPFCTTGSSASVGSWPRTCCTFDNTSMSAWSGSAPSSMFTVTVEEPSRLCDDT